MYDLASHGVQVLYKRATNPPSDGGPDYELPAWAWAVALANFILFLPIILYVNYSLKYLYPVFAIVEDENPPAYEPVALDADVDHHNIHGRSSKPTDGAPAPVSSSLRAINRVLRSQGGSLLSNFRGFGCWLAQLLLVTALVGLFANSLGGVFTPFATLLAVLTLVSVSTAWVHIVISQPDERRFWHRLPPFGRTFEATWKPVLLYWAACEVRRWLPTLVMAIIGFHVPDSGYDLNNLIDGRFFVMLAIVGVVDFVFAVFVIIPTHVIVVRVQASLLPPGEDPIIPFDRSFHGQVQTALVGGRGYATISEAWSTFSRAAWRRLIVLYIKIFIVTACSVFVMLAIILPETSLIAQKVHAADNSN